MAQCEVCGTEVVQGRGRAGGALSLGYAMTVAASQGLTTQVSLLYGHGANAFAVCPGIRGRQENHICLPLAVVEGEDTRARLGAARSERGAPAARGDRVSRSTSGRTRATAWSPTCSANPRSPPSSRHRPYGRVKPLRSPQTARRCRPRPDPAQAEATAAQEAVRRRAAAARTTSPLRSRPPAEPADTPAPRPAEPQEPQPELTEEQRQQLAELERSREQRAVPSWSDRAARPYGRRSDAALVRMTADYGQRAKLVEQAAAAAALRAKEMDERLERERATGATRGHRATADVAGVLDEADRHMTTARAHQEQADAARNELARIDTALTALNAHEGKSRLELRLAGTSRKEHRQLTDRYRADQIRQTTALFQADAAARDGADTAWQAVRTSPAAQLLQGQVAGQPPRGVEETAHRLAVLHQALPDLARRIDRTDLEDVARLHGNATRSAQDASGNRANAAAVRTEQHCAPPSPAATPSCTTPRTRPAAPTSRSSEPSASSRPARPQPAPAAATSHPGRTGAARAWGR
jgi:hypothetical protein